MQRKSWNNLTLEALLIGVDIDERRLGLHVCGQYDPNTRLAVIDSSLNPVQKLCTLQHELIHAVHFDAGLGVFHPEKEEDLTRAETAFRLINARDYAEAECLCGGEGHVMAELLGVTYSILLDYRSRFTEKYVQRILPATDTCGRNAPSGFGPSPRPIDFRDHRAPDSPRAKNHRPHVHE